MESKLGSHNLISENIENVKSPDGRGRYSISLRAEIYAHIINIVKSIQPELGIALCLEEDKLWKSCGIEGNQGRCNCVL